MSHGPRRSEARAEISHPDKDFLLLIRLQGCVEIGLHSSSDHPLWGLVGSDLPSTDRHPPPPPENGNVHERTARLCGDGVGQRRQRKSSTLQLLFGGTENKLRRKKVRNWPRERLCHCRRWSQWEAAQNSWIHHTNVYELSSIRTPQNFYGLKIPDGGILLRRLTSKKFKFLPNMRSHGKVILHFGGGMLGHPPDRPE